MTDNANSTSDSQSSSRPAKDDERSSDSQSTLRRRTTLGLLGISGLGLLGAASAGADPDSANGGGGLPQRVESLEEEVAETNAELADTQAELEETQETVAEVTDALAETQAELEAAQEAIEDLQENEEEDDEGPSGVDGEIVTPSESMSLNHTGFDPVEFENEAGEVVETAEVEEGSGVSGIFSVDDIEPGTYAISTYWSSGFGTEYEGETDITVESGQVTEVTLVVQEM